VAATARPSFAGVHALPVVHPLEDHLVPHVGRRQGHRLEVKTNVNLTANVLTFGSIL
jgi:hypothetical protein